MTATYDPRPDWSREDRERELEAQRPQLETLVEIAHFDWHAHRSVTELKNCEALREAADEAAYERWIEEGERDGDLLCW